MNSRHSRRLTIALGLVLTIAALVAPSANAKMQKIYSDHGVTLASVSSEPSPNLALSDRGVVPITPDRPVLAVSDHGVVAIPPPQSGPTPVVNLSPDNPSSFDWAKTGLILSLSMLGLLLLGGGALLASKQTRRRRLAAA
jgi:hypothetical protein